MIHLAQIRFAWCIAVFAACTTAANAAPAALPCVRTAKPPGIDAKLDDACWARAASAVDFSVLGSDGFTPATQSTRVRVAYDAGHFYFAVECNQPNVADMVLEVADRDGPVHQDDCIEIFLAPADQPQQYLQIVINAHGAVFDQQARDGNWSANVRSAGAITDAGWRAEAAIALSDLPLPTPADGVVWAANFAHTHRTHTDPTRWSTWASLAGRSLHQPDQFGSIRFEGDSDLSTIDVSSRPLSINLDVDGKVHGTWTPGKGTSLRETAYLSGRYVLEAGDDALVARRSVNAWGLAGTMIRSTMTLRSPAREGAAVVLVGRTADDQPVQAVLLDASPDNASPARFRGEVVLPSSFVRATAVEIRRSAGAGHVEVTSLSVSLATSSFAEVTPATSIFRAERMPRGPILESPAVAWARPLSAGPLDALFIVASPNQRTTIELAQRIDVRPDYCWVAGGVYFSTTAERVNARLGDPSRRYDVIVVAAPIDNVLIADALRDAVQAGAGLVYLHKEGDTAIPPGWAEMLPAASDAVDPLLANLPLSLLPRVPDNYRFTGNVGSPAFAGAVFGAFGEGRVGRVAFGAPGGLYNGVIPHGGNNPSLLNDSWEYAYAAVARAMLHVADRTLPSMQLQPGSKRCELVVTAARDFAGVVEATWLDHDAPPINAAVNLAAGASVRLAFDMPESLQHRNGCHVVRLILRDERGGVCDWAADARQVQGALRLSPASPLARKWFLDRDAIRAEIRIDNAGDESRNLTLQSRVTDVSGRVIWRDQRDVTAGRGRTVVSHSPDTALALSVYHQFEVDLSEAGTLIDHRNWPFHLPDLAARAMNDFQSGLYGDYFRRVHTDGVFTDWVESMGFRFTGEGGPFTTAPKLNMSWLRINTDWETFHHRDHTGYSRQPVRTPCLSDPQTIAAAVTRATASARVSFAHGAYLVNMGDESELAKDGMTEVCFGDRCVERFSQWVRQRYQTLDQLNHAWGTELTAWTQVAPIRSKQAREQGATAPFVDFRIFMEEVWTDAFVQVRDAIHREVPGAQAAFTNPFHLNPFSGSDHARLADAEDFFLKYFRPDIEKLYASFQPDTLMIGYWGYDIDTWVTRWYPWHFAMNGGDALIWYSAGTKRNNHDLFDGTYQHTQRSEMLIESQADLHHGVGKILREFPLHRSGVAIVYSQPSMHVSWLESGAPSGQEIWASRAMAKLPADHPFAMYTRSAATFETLIRYRGLQPTWITPEQLTGGELDGVRVIILPCTAAISDATVDRLVDFARHGGTVIADERFALYHGNGRQRDSDAALQQLFGVRRNALGPYERDLGRGRTVYFGRSLDDSESTEERFAAAIESADVTAPLKITDRPDSMRGYELFEYRRGPVRIFGLLRDLPPVDAAHAGLMTWYGPDYRHGSISQESITVQWPESAYAFDVRAGKALGKVNRAELDVAPADATLLALLPYQVRSLNIDMPAATPAGHSLAYRLAVGTDSATPGDHILRVEWFAPDGRVVKPYVANVLAVDGEITMQCPFALNDPRGAWRLRVTDVFTGVAATQTVQLRLP